MDTFLEQHKVLYQIMEELTVKTSAKKSGLFLFDKGVLRTVYTTVPSSERLIVISNTPYERSIITKEPLRIRKKCPPFGDVSNSVILPLLYNEEVVGIAFFEGSVAESQYKDLLSLLSLHLYCIQLELKLKDLNSDDKYLSSKNLFLASMSHEIRNPLNGIVGFTQLLLSTPLNEVQRGYVNSMRRCSLSLVQIINDILDYSKLMSGKMTLNKTAFSVNEVVEFVDKTLSIMMYEKKHTFIKEVSDKNLPPLIVTDKNKLIQILINLVSNAIKFTDTGGKIILRVVVEPSLKAKKLRFSVQDTGIGIGKEDLAKLFKSFVTIDSILSNYSGAGLGLAISKRLVELFQGEISVESSLYKGSLFTFTISYDDYLTVEKKLASKSFKGRSIIVCTEKQAEYELLCELLVSWKTKPFLYKTPSDVYSFVYSQKPQSFDLGIISERNSKVGEVLRGKYPSLPILLLSETPELIPPSKIFNGAVKCNKSSLYEKFTEIFNEQSFTGALQVQKMKILVTDDFSYNCDLLKAMLESLGYTDVTTVESGAETIQKLRESSYDLLLLDLKMPKMNGYEVIEALQGISIKIIPVSASVLEEDKEKCRSYGLELLLKKPIEINELKKVLYTVQN